MANAEFRLSGVSPSSNALLLDLFLERSSHSFDKSKEGSSGVEFRKHGVQLVLWDGRSVADDWRSSVSVSKSDVCTQLHSL